MSEPVRTRSEVEREVREAAFWMGSLTAKDADRISTALLAMAECDCKDGFRWYLRSGSVEQYEQCRDCRGTRLHQSRVARGLNALEGR